MDPDSSYGVLHTGRPNRLPWCKWVALIVQVVVNNSGEEKEAPSICFLNTFLRHLGLEESCRNMVDLDVDSKVEEILKRLVSSPTSDFRFMEFKRISYPNLVRQALYPDDYVDAVEDFIDWHNGLFEQIHGHLKTFPDEIGKYDQIERVGPIHTILWVHLTESNGRNYARKALRIGPCPRVYSWSGLTAHLHMPCHNPPLTLYSVLYESFPDTGTPLEYWNSTLCWRCAFDGHTCTLRTSIGHGTSGRRSIYSNTSQRYLLKT